MDISNQQTTLCLAVTREQPHKVKPSREGTSLNQFQPKGSTPMGSWLGRHHVATINFGPKNWHARETLWTFI